MFSENEPIVTFSGAHPFRPRCLIAELEQELRRDGAELGSDLDNYVLEGAAELCKEIDSGICPRCREPFDDPPLLPAGSRVTTCRCVPVCKLCGDHEAVAGMAIPGDPPRECYWYGIWEWLEDYPIREEMEDQLARVKSASEIAIFDLESRVAITGDGGFPVQDRQSPGGWLEFGYDDDEDREEHRGRHG